MSSTEAGPYAVRALDRALTLLDAFSLERRRMTLADLAIHTGLPKSTVFRLAATLAARGYLERAEEHYEIGLRCFQLGSIFRASIDLRARALPHLIALRDATGETVQLAVLSGDNIVYLERVYSQQPVAYMRSTVGAVLPVYCTGLGKALLAFEPSEAIDGYLERVVLERHTPNTIVDHQAFLAEMAAIRRQGYAVDREEREVGVRCIAAPIFEMTGRCVAALSIAAPSSRLSLPVDASPLVPAVRGAAQAVSHSLGFRTGHD